jgi:hypothetical protein
MKNLTKMVVTGLFLSTVGAQAAQSALDQKANVNNNAPQCPDVKLYRDVPDGQRSTLMTRARTDDPLYLSTHYCFAFFSGSEQKDIEKLPAKLSFNQTRRLFRRYGRTYDTLTDDQQRIAFAHLYLKMLSEQALVLPYTNIENKIKYSVSFKDKDKTVLFSANLANSKDYHLLYNGLLELADKPLIDKDWPELVKLVELVLTNLDSKSAQSVEMLDVLAQR